MLNVTAEASSKIKVEIEEGKVSVPKEAVETAVQHAEEVKKLAEGKCAEVKPILEIETTSSSGNEAAAELPAEALSKLAEAETHFPFHMGHSHRQRFMSLASAPTFFELLIIARDRSSSTISFVPLQETFSMLESSELMRKQLEACQNTALQENSEVFR